MKNLQLIFIIVTLLLSQTTAHLSQEDKSVLEVYSLRGQLLIQKPNFNRSSFTLPSSFSSGVFLVRLRHQGSFITHKISPGQNISFEKKSIGINQNTVISDKKGVSIRSTNSSNLSEKITKIRFINGIDNTRRKAQISSKELKSIFNAPPRSPAWGNEDPDHHNFVHSYLNSALPSHDSILNALFSLDSVIPYRIITPEMSVTLKWDGVADLDLHTFEPDGVHIFYAHMSEDNSGYLDVDNTTSNGPENYYVKKEKMKEGIYKFGVNYYSGSGSKSGTLTIRLNDEEPIIFPFTVSTPVGSFGNATPQVLGKVEVNKVGNSYYMKCIE